MNAEKKKLRVLILGAGFGGLELATILSQKASDRCEIVLVDHNDSFIFGFSKFDVMFGRKTLTEIRHYYKNMVKPGVRFVQTQITAIDPAAKRVATEAGEFMADILIVALGAEYDFAATPGLEKENEFYSVAGAEKLHQILPSFQGGSVIVGVCGAPFKCPPAPSEAALLLHDYLQARGLREKSEITLVIPFKNPVPPSPETSQALLKAFTERGIRYIPERRVLALDTKNKKVALSDGSKLSYDLFLGVPAHRAPEVVTASPLAEGVWIPVEPRTLETKFPGVYAIGDVTSGVVPKAGVFAEGEAKIVAADILARYFEGQPPSPYAGAGTCYIEFGHETVARFDINFLSGRKPIGTFHEPSATYATEKAEFGSSRVARWFTHE